MNEHNPRTGQPTTVKDVLRQSIFFSEAVPYEERKKIWERSAKMDMIKDVMDIYVRGGQTPSSDLFDELYDMSIDQLHMATIKAQDLVYNLNRKR